MSASLEEGTPKADYSNLEVTADEEAQGQDSEQQTTLQRVWSYLLSADFREIICCFLVGVAALLTEVPGIRANERPIPSQLLESTGEYVVNLSLAEVFSGETIPPVALAFIAFVGPILIQFILSKTVGRKGDAHATVCVYFAGLGLTGLVTNLVKSYAGYLRPIFYSQCLPDDDYQECTSDDDDDYRKSFPSGHASLAFCGLTLLTCYLLARFGVYSGTAVLRESPDGTMLMEYQKPARIKKLYSILSLAPMALATFVAASRVVDNKHFPADVVGGSVLGAAMAWFVHGVWYLAWPYT